MLKISLILLLTLSFSEACWRDRFVNIKEELPKIHTDIRYFEDHNFVGKRITGYQEPLCLMTKEAATALKPIQWKLEELDLSLKVYDCYRPQRSVDEFASWAKDISDNKMKQEFYPKVDKTDLFDQGYIAYKSGHTRGSTIDLTIVPMESSEPDFEYGRDSLVSCTEDYDHRFHDNTLDCGSGFDCFSPVSHPDYNDLSTQAKAN
jgi:D-alanyl-D-alanine dipeptidase